MKYIRIIIMVIVLLVACGVSQLDHNRDMDTPPPDEFTIQVDTLRDVNQYKHDTVWRNGQIHVIDKWREYYFLYSKKRIEPCEIDTQSDSITPK